MRQPSPAARGLEGDTRDRKRVPISPPSCSKILLSSGRISRVWGDDMGTFGTATEPQLS